MSAGGNWSEELFVVARLRRANNIWGNSSYIIAELDQTQPNNIGDHKSGVYTRQQLLHCPLETLNYLSSSDDDSSDDDSSDDDETHRSTQSPLIHVLSNQVTGDSKSVMCSCSEEILQRPAWGVKRP